MTLSKGLLMAVLSFIDPGISFIKNNFSINLNVPFAIRRERPQSLTDIETSEMTGTFRNGDAAFADYLINFAVSDIFSGKKHETKQASSTLEVH